MSKTRYPQTRITRAADGILGGVCAGLGRRFGVSANLIRVLWLLAVLFFGTGLLLYLALWWIIPHEEQVPVETVVWRRSAAGSYTPPLRRTVADRKLLGVCGGLARRFDLDPSVVRLLVLALATVSLGLVAVAYLVAAIFIPGPDESLRAPVYPVEL
jgi:phage shock protein PspC (stress-responsive transcriptional regulator)